MDVTSFQFLGFTLAAGLLYNLRGSVFWRQTILLIANVAFLAAMAANWKAYVPLAAFLGIGYLSIRLMRRQGWRGLFFPLTGLIILLYIWLKKYSFIPDRFFLPLPYVTIGLSYIFFRVVHMIVDARDEAYAQSVGIVPYLNYTLNFTTIAAGPIQLYPDFAASQLRPVRPPLTLAQCGIALERVVIGFFKLRILSAIFLAVQQAAIARLSEGQGLADKIVTGGVIVTAYTMYLYFNFSGFVDMMIGAARVFRMDLPENFDRPFSATSFIEFWSRWHMSLSNWLKTYVYLPLVKVLMRKFPSPQIEPFLGVAGFFVTFFLVGVWHGQTSEFLCFGLLQGGGVSLNKLYQILLAKAVGRKRYKALDKNAFYCALSRGLTFTYFTFTLIWFWSSWQQIGHLASALSLTQEILMWMAVWLGSAAALGVWEELRNFVLRVKWDGDSVLLAPPVRAAWAGYLAILTVIALSIVTVSTSVMYQIF
jgi:alginate O-acetyltransferase complex protein AlgI